MSDGIGFGAISVAEAERLSGAKLSAWIRSTDRTAVELSAFEGRAVSIDRLIASHACAGAETLSRLSHSTDRATRARVCRNPGTPKADYVRLGQQFPDEFVENPALDLLVLEEPALIQETPNLLLRILKSKKCPESFLIWAAAHLDEKVQLAVAMHPRLPSGALERLKASTSPKVRETAEAAELIGLTPAKAEAAFVQAVVQRISQLDESQFDEAWRAKDIGLAQWPILTLWMRNWTGHTGMQGPGYRSYQSEVKNASSDERQAVKSGDLLFYSGTDPNRSVLAKRPLAAVMALCAGPYIEPSRIARVVSSSDWLVRAAVARNRGTPENLLKRLVADSHPVVRALAQRESGNPDLSDAAATTVPLNRLVDEVRGRALSKFGVRQLLRHQGWIELLPMEDLWTLAVDCIEEIQTVLVDTDRKLLWESALALPDSTLKQAVASLPQCPPSILEKFAAMREPYALVGVLLNPKAPIEVLEKAESLVNGLPEKVVAAITVGINPIDLLSMFTSYQSDRVDLERLERDDVFWRSIVGYLANDQNTEVRRSVASYSHTPTDVLEKLATDPDLGVRCAVSKNPNTPADTLAGVASDPKAEVKFGVAGNPKTPLLALVVLAKDRDANIRGAVAGNTSAPISVLEDLAKDAERSVRERVAANFNTPDAVLEALAKDKSIHSSFVGNSRAPTNILMALAVGKSWMLRCDLASRLNASYGDAAATVLEALSKDPDHNVRREVASNLNTPAAVLEVLSKDPSDQVRRFVASNINTPASALEALSKDPGSSVRCNVASNANTPASALEVLSKDPDWSVRDDVASNTNTPASALEVLSKDPDSHVRDDVAVNRNTPASALEVLSKDPDEEIRWLVAGHIGTPKSVLEVLGGAQEWYVRRRVASNPNTPAATLEILAADTDFRVREHIALNPNTPPPVLAALVSRHSGESGPAIGGFVVGTPDAPVWTLAAWSAFQPEVLEAIIEKIPHIMIRILAATNTRTPASTLATLAEDPVWWVRAEVALNRSTPESIRGTLAKDKDHRVRICVSAHPCKVVRSELAARILGRIDGLAFSKHDELARYKKMPFEDIPATVRVDIARHTWTSSQLLEKFVSKEPCFKEIAPGGIYGYPDWLQEKIRQSVSCREERSGMKLDASDREAHVQEIVTAEIREAATNNANYVESPSFISSDRICNAVKNAISRFRQQRKRSVPALPTISPAELLSVLVRLGCIQVNPDNKELTKASRSKDWLTRMAVALHPSATPGILKLLRDDADRDVAGVVAQRIRYGGG